MKLSPYFKIFLKSRSVDIELTVLPAFEKSGFCYICNDYTILTTKYSVYPSLTLSNSVSFFKYLACSFCTVSSLKYLRSLGEEISVIPASLNLL